MLKGIKIANFYIIQKKIYHVKNSQSSEIIHQIIDGKQRLSTMISFVKGEFSITVNGEDYFWEDLSDEAQRAINFGCPNSFLAYEYVYSDGVDNVIISDDEKIAWFEMINFAGTPQDIEHLNNLKS